MSQNKKILFGVVAVIVIILIVWVAQHKSDSDSHVIKIGIVAPLTGGGAIFGNATVKAVELAQQDLKNNKYTYKVIVEDDGGSPGQSASAAQKLINIDGVKAIISMTSGTGNAVAPIADTAHVVHICTCTDTKVGYGKYNFTNLVMPIDEAPAYLDAVARRGFKTIAMISQNHPGINAIVDEVRTLAPSKGISIIYDQKFDGTNRDFKTIVSKAKQVKADMYYVVAFPPSLDILGKELDDNSVGPISSSAAFGISATPSLFEGDWTTDGSASKEFETSFETKFPDTRFNTRSAAFGYDSFNVLVRGFETGTKDIASYVGNIDSFEGVAGHVTRVGNNFRSPVSLWSVKNGKLVLLDK